MSFYKNYIVKQNDTIELIADKYLGGSQNAGQIIEINKLRFPYISSNPKDKLSLSKTESSLTSALTYGSTSINLSSYISSKSINEQYLRSRYIFFISSSTSTGSFKYDKFFIKKYYSRDELVPSNTDGNPITIPSGTLVFDCPVVAPPSISAQDAGLLSFSQNCVFSGSLSGTTLTVTSISSGLLSVGMSIFSTELSGGSKKITENLTGSGGVGTYRIVNDSNISGYYKNLFASFESSSVPFARKYYVKYSYISSSGETLASPLPRDPYYGNSFSFSVPANQLLTVSSPLVWPDGVIAVKLYIGTSIGFESYQATLFTTNSSYIEPVNGLNKTTIYPPTSNTALIGFSSTYSSGTEFSVHENSDHLFSRVVSYGEILFLPSKLMTQSLIYNNSKSNQFISSLGSDMKLDTSGQLIFQGIYGGDIGTVSNVENLRQSLKNRLTTRFGELTTQPNYGNKALAYIGYKYRSSFLMMVRSAFIECVKQEPRIQKIVSLEIYYNKNLSAVIIKNLIVKVSEGDSPDAQISIDSLALRT